MKIYANEVEIADALAKVNRLFSGNVMFKRFERAGNHFEVTLTVYDARRPGARLGQCLTRSGKHPHIKAACWHVHGEFFDALPLGTKIVTAGRTAHAGERWNDWNIGSQMRPYYYSEACECNSGS